MPDPVNVRHATDEVTRRELEKVEQQLEDVRDELPEMERRIIAAAQEMATGAYKGRQKLWDQVNADRAEVAAAKARITRLEQQSS